MHDILGPGTTLGYCTNVHPGATLDEVKAGLPRYAVAVAQMMSPDAPMGIGLWLSAAAARELRGTGGGPAFAEWLAARGLAPFTLNGFPYGDFHRDVVKHDVYHPDWMTTERLDYTIDLVHLLADLVPDGGEGSLSTLPIGWRARGAPADDLAAAAEALRTVARTAAAIEAERGTVIHLDLEPEPGCRLEKSTDVVTFFREQLLGGNDDALLRRHLRVCHDVCHAAVMFEDQAEMFDRYDAEGIAVGKVQLSAAVRVPFSDMGSAERRVARRQLAELGERRYLHQTTIRRGGGREVIMHDDLPAALARETGDPGDAEWRVHYHVPVYAADFGRLRTTNDEIATCLRLTRARPTIRHFEVETYAWDVLPDALAAADLVSGIAGELGWVHAVAAEVT